MEQKHLNRLRVIIAEKNLLKITETTETETLFSPQSAFLSQAVGLFSATIPRALVGRGWLLNSLRR